MWMGCWQRNVFVEVEGWGSGGMIDKIWSNCMVNRVINGPLHYWLSVRGYRLVVTGQIPEDSFVKRCHLLANSPMSREKGSSSPVWHSSLDLLHKDSFWMFRRFTTTTISKDSYRDAYFIEHEIREVCEHHIPKQGESLELWINFEKRDGEHNACQSWKSRAGRLMS